MSQTDTIRSNFKQCITKLNEIDTRTQAMKQLQILLIQNKTTNNLRIWLSVLGQNRRRHIQSQIYVIDYIIKIYGKNLLDPIDKIPSLEKSIFRITEILNKYFGQQLQNVVIACQRTWVDIYEVTLKDQPMEIKKKLLYDSLEAIINGGGGKIAQTTAQFLVDGLLERALALEDLTFFKQIAKRVLVLFLKTTVIHPSTLICLQTILTFFNINNLLPLLQQLVTKIISYNTLVQGNSIGYKIKGQISNCLTIIGEQIDKNGIQIFDKVYKILNDLATDKVWAVQAPGRKALQIWQTKKKQWDQQFLSKNQRIINQPIHNFIPNQHPLTNIKQNISEYPKTYDNWLPNINNNPPYQNQQLHLQQKKNQTTYQRSWNYNLKKNNDKYEDNNFLQKCSGSGGGNNCQSVEQYYERQKPENTYQRKMQQIKKSIYQSKSQMEFQDTLVLDQLSNPKQQKLTNTKDPPPKPQQIPKNTETQDDNFLDKWQKILELAQQSKFQPSIKLLLEIDDDLYFLRFFLKYSSQLLGKLTRPTSNKVIQKMLEIKKMNFMQQLFMKMVAQSTKLGIGKMLTNQQNLQIINNLQNIGKISVLKQLSDKLLPAYQSSLNN